MFKRENRLAGDIRFNNSYSFSAPQFVLKVRKNRLLLNRFGIVVSRKIDKRAVVRNRVKRMFRDILKELDRDMIPGHDILVVTRVGVLDKTKEENQSIVKEALAKAGFIKLRVEK